MLKDLKSYESGKIGCLERILAALVGKVVNGVKFTILNDCELLW